VLKKSPLYLPMLVISILVLAATACYSDSAMWPKELTQPPPSATFLPTPSSDNPSKFTPGSIVIARKLGGADSDFFLHLTDHPEPPLQNGQNAAGICDFNKEMEILYTGRKTDTEVYYLVNCSSSVGWTSEVTLVGPLKFLKNQSALTTTLDPKMLEITNGVFGIHNTEPTSPPSPLPPTVNCKVGEVVDILKVMAPDADNVWFNIRCSAGIGWVHQDRLFGPLVLPATGGQGLVKPESGNIPLLTEYNSTETVGECPANSLVTTQSVQQVGDQVYYQLTCGDLVGWTLQDPLVEVQFLPDTLVVVSVPVVETAETETTTGEGEGTGETLPDVDPEATPEAAVIPTAPLTENAGPVGDDTALVGECPTNTIVHINEVTYLENTFFYNVTCNDITGWLEGVNLLVEANFVVGDQVAITEAGNRGTGANEGFHLSVEPVNIQGHRGTIGEGETPCMPNTLATINQFSVDVSGEGGEVIRVYYQVTCQIADGSELIGWAEQSRLMPASVLTPVEPSTEIFGG
jgi:hypothetical protein